jgi:hypothetical protein
VCFIAFGVLGSAGQRDAGGKADAAQFLGTWTGTWEGAGSGGFELTLEKGKDDAISGKVSVTGEATYKAAFKTLSFDGRKMSATYDFPPDDQAEIVLAATFDGQTATGTWSAREKANGNGIMNGTWTVTRQ